MDIRYGLIAVGGVLTFGILSTSVQAGAVGNAASLMKGAAKESVEVLNVASRRCWRQHGHRHCNWNGYYSAREYGFPENYRTGSSNWWAEMDRTDRGGRSGGRR